MIERPPCPLPEHPDAVCTDEGIERLTLEEAIAEARRCLSLNECRGCQMCVLLCPDQAITLDEATGRPVIDLAYCKHCELCAHFCPKGAISMQPSSAP